MTSSDNILDQIDSALCDLTVSGDAMRSQPDAARTQDEGDGDWHGFTMGGLVVGEATIVVDASEAFIHLDALREALAAWGEAIRPRLEEVGRALDQVGETARAATDSGCGHQPAPRRDRPAWQSPYGPAVRRR